MIVFNLSKGNSAHVRGGYGFFVRMLIVDVSRTDKDYIARVMVHSETGAVDSNASRIPFGEVEAPLTEGEIQKYKDFAARLVKYEAFSLGVTEDGEVHVSLKFDKNPVKLLKLKEGRTPLDVYKMFDERTVREKIGDWYLLYRTDLETGLGETSH